MTSMVAYPKDAADDVISRARAMLDAAENQPEDIADTVALDLTSLALAMGMAAIDTYLHWAVRRVDLNHTSNALRNLDIPFGDLVDSSRVSLAARAAGRNDRPTVRARNALNGVILSETFQSARGVEKAMGYLGVRGYWATIAANMPGNPHVPDVRDRLNQLAYTRNRIVHEGDLERQIRPQQVRRENRVIDDIRLDLNWIESFIDGMEAAIY